MMGKVPPMGWNSWNTFGNNISEELFCRTADKMAETGLKDAGYEYIIIDDCWSEKKRNGQGKLVEDKKKFPNGMKWLGNYIHQKGLKFGLYSCAGILTCAGYPGSFEHEFEDAATFAQYGADYLKYDYCFNPVTISGDVLYKTMSMALKASGRDILFAACNWGKDHSEAWMDSTGAHTWRSTGDIQDNWQSIKSIAQKQVVENILPYGKPHCYNDMDMLVVGMNGKGNVGLGGCTYEEYKTHFSLWCMHSSPLIIGCDIREIKEDAKTILMNKELIAIDQDVEGRSPFVVATHSKDISYQAIYVKPLSDGSYAICFVNYSDEPVGSLQLIFSDIGLSAYSGYGLHMRDLWEHKDIGFQQEGFSCSLPAHGCAVYRATVKRKA